MRLSHKRKVAHKKGVYHPRLTCSLLRIRWQKRLYKQLAKSKGSVLIEVNSPGGEVSGFSRTVNAFKRLADVATRPFRAWSSVFSVTDDNKTPNQA